MCADHVYARGDKYYNSYYRIPQNSNNSASGSVENWLLKKNQQNKYIDLTQWPDNKPCSGISGYERTD